MIKTRTKVWVFILGRRKRGRFGVMPRRLDAVEVDESKSTCPAATGLLSKSEDVLLGRGFRYKPGSPEGGT